MEQFRDYLLTLTRAEMEPWLQGKLDPDDVVQQTLLKAHQGQGQFQGRSEAEQAGWLRSILRNLLNDARRKFGRRGEQRLATGGNSGCPPARPEEWLVSDQSSPSQRAMQSELMCRLDEAMARLPDDQRTALELKYLHGHSVPEVGRRMRRTTAAVAGLLRRGLRALREVLDEDR